MIRLSAFHLKDSGATLLESLVSISIFSILLFVGITITSQSNSYLSEIRKKVEFVNSMQIANIILSKKSTCDCQFQNLTFDSTSVSSLVTVPSLKSNCAPGNSTLLFRDPNVVATSGILVEKLILNKFNSTGNSNEYIADFLIKPNVGDIENMNTVPIPVRFYTDPDSPDTAKKILACGAAPLTSPSGLTVTPGDSQCVVNWHASSGGTPITYTLRKSTTAGGSVSGTVSCTTVNQTCLVVGLTNETNYYFSVSATNSYEGPKFSNEILCKPLAPPSVPVLTVLPIGADTCAASWTASTGSAPNSYEVRSSVLSGGASAGQVACSTSSTNCNISGLSMGHTYYFTVRSSNPLGTSAFSSEVSCMPQSTQQTYVFTWANFNGTAMWQTFPAPPGYTKVRMVSISKAFPDGTPLDTSTVINIGGANTYWYNSCDNSSYFQLYFQSDQTVKFVVRADDDCGFFSWNWHGGSHTYVVEFLP